MKISPTRTQMFRLTICRSLDDCHYVLILLYHSTSAPDPSPAACQPQTLGFDPLFATLCLQLNQVVTAIRLSKQTLINPRLAIIEN